MPVSMLSTSLFSDRKSYSRFNALDTIYTPPSTSKPGMVLVSPTSITHSGTSATLGANGQVTFSAVTSLSLNGVFTADFDNYVLSMRCDVSALASVNYRLRASGTDNSTASSYVYQLLAVDSTSRTAAQSTTNQGRFSGGLDGTQRAGFVANLYGPALAQPTTARSVSVGDRFSAYIYDVASTHNQSVSYDGITILIGSANATGALQVYGVRS